MKLIYYSTALYATHGGGNQSILFLKETEKSELVEKVLVFPRKGKVSAMSSGGFKSRVRHALRKIGLLQILFFYRRNKFYLDELTEMIERESPGAILIQTDSSFLQINYLKKKFPNLTVGTVVNSSPFDEPFSNIAFIDYFRRLERRSLSLADCNFFVSRLLEQRIMADLSNPKRDFVIHNGVDTEVFRPLPDRASLRERLGIPKDKFVIGYVGTLDIHKRIHILLQAFKLLLQDHPETILVIVGSGPDFDSSVKMAEDLNVNSHVKFTGWVNHQHIPEYLNCFDLAIHHYANEYMSPLKIFEYLSAGLPVVGPSIPGVREVFSDRKHLVLTDGSPADVAQKISELINNPTLRNSIAQAGRELILRDYTWKQNAHFILSRLKEKIKK